jgi:hypothetical protein
LSCENFDICRNNTKCFRCRGMSLYKEKKVTGFSKKNSNKEGMEFQRKVVKKYNRKIKLKPQHKTARERPNSGAMYFAPGDIAAEEFLIEAKERGIKASGKTQFTITKKILDKIEEEAGLSKPGIVTFGFKNSEEIYSITKFDLLLELYQTIDILRYENIGLRNQICQEKDED